MGVGPPRPLQGGGGGGVEARGAGQPPSRTNERARRRHSFGAGGQQEAAAAGSRTQHGCAYSCLAVAVAPGTGHGLAARRRVATTRRAPDTGRGPSVPATRALPGSGHGYEATCPGYLCWPATGARARTRAGTSRLRAWCARRTSDLLGRCQVPGQLAFGRRMLGELPRPWARALCSRVPARPSRPKVCSEVAPGTAGGAGTEYLHSLGQRWYLARSSKGAEPPTAGEAVGAPSGGGRGRAPGCLSRDGRRHPRGRAAVGARARCWWHGAGTAPISGTDYRLHRRPA